MADNDFDPDSSENSAARESVLAAFRIDSDLNAFALDSFPRTYAEFPSDMETNDKINLLLKENGAETVLAALSSFSDKVEEQKKDDAEPHNEFPVSTEDCDKIVNAFSTASDLDAFLIDNFIEVKRQCSDGMTTNQRVELLLRMVGSGAVFAKLPANSPEKGGGDASEDASSARDATADYTIQEMVAILGKIFPVYSDFAAFVLDFFPDVFRQYASGMDRNRQYEVLFQMQSVTEVVEALGQAGETLTRGSEPQELKPPLPSNSVLSDVLGSRFRAITDFNLFVMSNFREVYDQFQSWTTRSERISLLVESVAPEEIIEALNR